MAANEHEAVDRAHAPRQDRKIPLLIRDDGMLMPNTALLRSRPRFRLYHGDPKASLEDRMRYLKGLQSRRKVVMEPVDEPFNLATADSDTLIQFALDQYGVVLDPSKPAKVLREMVFALAQKEEQGLSGDDGESSSPEASGGLGLAAATKG